VPTGLNATKSVSTNAYQGIAAFQQTSNPTFRLHNTKICVVVSAQTEIDDFNGRIFSFGQEQKAGNQDDKSRLAIASTYATTCSKQWKYAYFSGFKSRCTIPVRVRLKGGTRANDRVI
jgi:hypothetical protein